MYRLILLLLIFSIVLPVHAQENSRLTYGQTVSGTLNTLQFRHLYNFRGAAGENIRLAMTTTDGDLDPYLVLMAPGGNVIAISDDDGASNNAVITALTLPSSGDFFIVATRFGQEHGTTEGIYRLTLELITSTATSPLVGASISLGARTTGQLDQNTFEQIFRFEALRGQVLNIQMRRTSGNLDPMLDLLDGTGQPLIFGDDENPDTSNAGIVNFTIPSDGIYFIRATRYGRQGGTSSGSYVLSINQIPVEELGKTPGSARLISYGDVTTGGIDQETYTRFFRFEGTRGDVISAIVSRESGNLAPRVSLLDHELRTLSLSPDSPAVSEARIPGASLSDDGIYYLVVSRYSGEEGTSEGEFTVQLNGNPGIGAPNSLELIYGAQLNGFINDERFMELYVFQGEAGDRINITMENIEGNLDPLLTLRDWDRKQLAFSDDDIADTQDAFIENFVLPETGVYRLEASRYEKQAGTTSGTYLLTIDKLN